MILCRAVVAVPTDSDKKLLRFPRHISSSKFAQLLEKLATSYFRVFQEFLDLIQFMGTTIRSESLIYIYIYMCVCVCVCVWSLKRSLHRIRCQIMTFIRCE